MTTVNSTPETALTGPAVQIPSHWQRGLRRFIRQPGGIIGVLVLLLYLVMAAAPSLLAPHSPLTAYPGEALHIPSGRFLLGTDPIGRDVLSRIIYGARPAILVGVIAVAIGASVGVLSGMAAGYYANTFTSAIMRVWDGVFAVPAILVGLMLAATFGAGTTTVAIAAGIIAAPGLARISHAAALSQTQLGYVEAVEALGFSKRRIFFGHVVPNSLSPVIVQLAMTMALAILLESGLAFLGVSAQPPSPDWGAMLADSRNYLSQAWWYGLFPGVAITLLVLAINLVADAARDAFDPKTTTSGTRA
jgi:ABC-type dipeptide/oligopeptide/nickel transport system permease subunit